jgi:hypothetical protein
VGQPTLQGARTMQGSRSPGTARGTRSPGTRGERDHQARVGGCLFFYLLVAIGQGSTLAIRLDLRSPGHVRRATSQWAGPLWRVREHQAHERVPTGHVRASLDPRRPLPSGTMACGARSSFFSFVRSLAGTLADQAIPARRFPRSNLDKLEGY